MRITHVVCTQDFAGVESHVAVLAAAQHDRGHEVTVLGGDVERMRAAIDRPAVSVRPVRGILDAVRQLAGPAGSAADLVATHMSAADLAATIAPTLVGTPIVSTRHFAARRGSRAVSRAALWLTARRMDAEIAVSSHIRKVVGGEPTVVLPGIPHRHAGESGEPREPTVLMVQRLEAEKQTEVGIRAFAASGLADDGWQLRVAGDGAERPRLEALARELGIGGSTTFLGHRHDVDALMSRASIFMATCGVEGLGLAVVEAMASGLPVVASAAAGHLETVGPVAAAALFPVGDPVAAGRLLVALAHDPRRRAAYGAALRARQHSTFSITGQAAATDAVYEHAAARRAVTTGPADRCLVVISLEPWDEVWRRNQHLVAGLLRTDPGLRVLFVEPPSDLSQAIRTGSLPRPGRGLRIGPRLDGVAPGAIWLHEPTKPLPRLLDHGYDRRWARGILRSASRAGLPQPTLWVNDPAGAELLEMSDWPALYDITDDWLAAQRDDATHARLVRQEDELMQGCAEVVVCSTGLVRTKSPRRPVTLIQNAVDAEGIRRARARPADLPPGPVAVYVGTLHSDRLDLGLCVATADALGDTGTLVLVGPNALGRDEDARLAAAGVVRLGPRPASEVGGYLQHADVLVVPHVVDEFTESLDPIKLHEYLAAGRVVVSTPVSGFRDVADERRRVVPAQDFAATVAAAVPASDTFPTGSDPTVPTWAERVEQMRAVLERVSGGQPGDGVADVPLGARVRLGHAAIQHIAATHGVDLLHIKGAAIDDAMTHPGRRPGDIDVLVRPEDVALLLRLTTDAGFRLVSGFRTGSPFGHAATLDHPVWGHLDVHRHFPGIGLDATAAFDHLWEGRTHRDIGGARCATPGPAAHGVLLVLHAARNVEGGQATADVEHVWHHADDEARAAMAAEAVAIGAETAFAVGTGETDRVQDAAGLRDWLALTQGDSRLSEWRARIRTAPDAPSRLRLIAMLPLVNTDALAARLGRPPTPGEIARAFVDRVRQAVVEVTGRAR
ncbi:glycosyltransferase [Janibacter indicus]|uniref:Glycosyltransferase involved in cell wall bisynthesis n=1 Tax=Janibacter indicus TaxID=857417 RepID=A0A1W1ZPG4_9MICO|nr:glycosyltransferase [Janibacter indicus]SMC50450.1 Glycosyltransferase involved in cell wall bisynthesis [Janibacter indicus]